MQFKPVTKRDLNRLRRYYEPCEYELCEYSALVKLMWRTSLHPRWAEEAGCLIINNRIDGELCFDYPVPGPDGDVDAALDAIGRWCVDEGQSLTISCVPQEVIARLLLRYPNVDVTERRNWRDYLYTAEDMREFAGRRYSGQRNHINKFRKACPGARFRVLTPEDMPLVEDFWQRFEAAFEKSSVSARTELGFARAMLSLLDRPWLLAGGMEYEGKLISFALAERCGSTLHIHIEKALTGYEGVYPATVQAFAQQYAVDGVRWVNREDDAGDRGLRTSKMQYLPDHLGRKYCFRVKNELHQLAALPTLKTPRLTLSPFTEDDRAAYNALCLDDERNRYWGYDYRQDWHGEPLDEYFLAVTRQDFAARLAANFAVRLDGKCIGEAVLYRFDGRGGAELGCRIAPEYAHHGYGAEAFVAAAEWGIYRLHLIHIVAKCYKENEASRRMLSACMRPAGEDETFYYFDKQI